MKTKKGDTIRICNDRGLPRALALSGLDRSDPRAFDLMRQDAYLSGPTFTVSAISHGCALTAGGGTFRSWVRVPPAPASPP